MGISRPARALAASADSRPASDIKMAWPCGRAATTRRGSRSSRLLSHSTHVRTRANRAGSSVSGTTRTSPRRPWARTISPMTTSRSLLNDLEDRALAELRGGRIEDRAGRPRGPPLLAADLSQGALGHPELDHRPLFPPPLGHPHPLGLVHHRPR